MRVSNTIKLLLLLLAITAIGSNVAEGQIFGVIVDPELQWQTLETEHFRVHFHQGLEDLAPYVAQISEESYAVIHDEFGQAPDKFDVIILDAFDFSNGSANFLTNFVTLIPSQYRLSDWANIRLDSWWNMLIFHEMVHAIELDMTMGINSVLRQIFGKTIAPNISKPVSFIEGLAVYQKYKHHGESRLNDSRTRMIIREMVLNNEIPDFEDIKGIYNSTDWPQPGFLVYNFSSWLNLYIEEIYGEDGMRRFNEANSASPQALMVSNDLNSVIEKAFDVSADELYEGFRAWLKDEFQAEMLEIQAQPITKAIQITQTGFTTGQPAWSPDGEWIAYVHAGQGRSGLRLVRPNGEEDHEITNGTGIAYPAWAPISSDEPDSTYNAKLLYTKAEAKGPYYILRDLYEFDLDTEREERVTFDERAYFGRYSPDGQYIYYAKNHGRDGSTALARLDRETEDIETLLEFVEGDGIIHSFSISPDGTQIAIALLRFGGFQDLYLMPYDGGELTPITQNQDQLSDPIWSPNGQYILYSADPNRRYNLYAYEASTSSFYQLTNMVAGAFYPTIAPDSSQIAFSSYEGTGYDLFTMPFDTNAWTPVQPDQATRPEWGGYPAHTYQFTPYNAISHLTPKGWIPLPIENGLGILAFGADPLFTHLYQVILGWDFERNHLYYNVADVMNLGLPIDLNLVGDTSGHSESVQVTVPLSISLSGSRQTLVTGYTRVTELEKLDDETEEIITLDVAEVTNRVRTNYIFTSSRSHDYFANLSALSATIELWNTNLDQTWLKRFVVNWTETFRIPTFQTHTFTTRLAAGWTDALDEDDKFKLGASIEDFLLLPDTYTFRGFDADRFTGTQFVMTTLQQHFTLVEIEWGVMHWPIFIDDLGVNLFVDAGMAGDKLNLKNLSMSYGAELSLSVTFAYGFGFEILAGVAHGIGEEQPQLYISFGI